MIISKNKIIRDFDKAAQDYDRHAKLQRVVAENLFASIKTEISNNHMVLDCGSGTGYFHELLRKNKIYCPLIQSDISHKMCLKAAEYASPPKYGGTYTVVADVEKLPIANNKIDIIFSSLTLQWAASLNAAINAMFAALRPSGVLAFSTVGAGSLWQLSESFAKVDSLPHINNNFLAGLEIKNGLEQAGFSEIAIREETITHYYRGIKELIGSIKGVGASYKSAEGRKYPGKNYFTKLEDIYAQEFGGDEGLPLSWNIIYVVAKK